MVDSDAASLLHDLNAKAGRPRLWPGAAACTAFLLILAASYKVGPLLWWSSALAGAITTVAAYLRDRLRRSVVIFYELDGTVLEAYGGLLSALSTMAKCGGVWRLEGRGEVYDRKYQAGASHVVTRQRASIRPDVPPCLVSNVKVPSLPIGRSKLYFFPDRVLAYGNGQFGAIPYADLEALSGETRFIESERVPSDATVVGHTWRFVNKDGGPDRRFNNNHQIPICAYEEMTLRSQSGMRAVFQLSKCGNGGPLRHAIGALAQSLEELRQKPRPQPLDSSDHASSQLPAVFHAVEKPKQEHYLTSLAVLCCVTVADGKLSTEEGSQMLAAMRELYSDRDGADVKQRMREFIERIKTDGFLPVLDETMEAAKQIRDTVDAGRLHDVLLRMKSDGDLKPRESRICDRFASILAPN